MPTPNTELVIDGKLDPHFRIGKLDEKATQSICKKVAETGVCSFAEANELLEDLLLFLSASVFWPNFGFRPPQKLDAVWHEFILHTPAYLSFCRELGVDYIHHIPDDINCKRTDVISDGLPLWRHLKSQGISFRTEIWEEQHEDRTRCQGGCDRGIQFLANPTIQ